jgi:hypothetical protein
VSDTAFFRDVDGLVVGNDAARGPWSVDACHAGPATAVIARSLEHCVPDKQLVRITVTFQRPVPMAGFRVAASPEGAGRTGATARAVLAGADGRTCAVAEGLFLATGNAAGLPTPTLPGPDIAAAKPGEFAVLRALHGLPFFNSGIEVAYPPGESSEPGPTTMWMRTIPIIEGEAPSPFEKLCPLADCGNGISRNTDVDAASFVNPDLTVAVFRLPASDWLASESVSLWEPNGIGLSQSQLFDTRGAIGYALQTLIVRAT